MGTNESGTGEGEGEVDDDGLCEEEPTVLDKA